MGGLLSGSGQRAVVESLDQPTRDGQCRGLQSDFDYGRVGARVHPRLRAGGSPEIHRSVLLEHKLGGLRRTVGQRRRGASGRSRITADPGSGDPDSGDPGSGNPGSGRFKDGHQTKEPAGNGRLFCLIEKLSCAAYSCAFTSTKKLRPSPRRTRSRTSFLSAFWAAALNSLTLVIGCLATDSIT